MKKLNDLRLEVAKKYNVDLKFAPRMVGFIISYNVINSLMKNFNVSNAYKSVSMLGNEIAIKVAQFIDKHPDIDEHPDKYCLIVDFKDIMFNEDKNIKKNSKDGLIESSDISYAYKTVSTLGSEIIIKAVPFVNERSDKSYSIVDFKNTIFNEDKKTLERIE